MTKHHCAAADCPAAKLLEESQEILGRLLNDPRFSGVTVVIAGHAPDGMLAWVRLLGPGDENTINLRLARHLRHIAGQIEARLQSENSAAGEAIN